MDDLIQHCMRELAFDGDLGCDVSRFHHFIQAFYTSQGRNQTVDNAFHSFVWSLLVQQPSVRVGLVPQGSTVEVYIAPQHSKKKKAEKGLDPESAALLSGGHGGEDSVGNANPFPKHLQLIDEANTSPLDVLIQHYGNGLRVAVDPETSFRAITGSHARPAKLTPMVYTALQLISRGREGGVSVIDLGKKTGYDQKTCFYLIKQLCELDLVVKLSKGGPGGGNFCIHKYFFTTSSFWKGVRREEVAENAERPEQGEGSRNDSQANASHRLQFEPIDARHLTSTKLIKLRLSRLLENSDNGLHTYQNLLMAIGFVNPTRRDRKFFTVRIRELIKEKFIEKVTVPRIGRSAKALCIRLVEDKGTSDTEGVIVQPIDVGDDEQEAVSDDKNRYVPVVNLTIHRQILRLLEEAGHDGMTLNNISARLGNFDKRTIDLLLSRLERYPPPPHLADLATCDFLENQGRERRHRYYTLPGYLSFIQRENIDHAGRTAQYTSRDFNHSGGFYHLSEDKFYQDNVSLVTYEDGYRDTVNPPKGGGKRKIGRPRKDGSPAKPAKKSATEEYDVTPAPRPRRGGTGATKALTDVKGADETRDATQTVAQRGTKRSRSADAEGEEHDTQAPQKRKRGRPPKKVVAGHEGVRGRSDADVSAASMPATTKRRGRPPKQPKVVSLKHASPIESTSDTNAKKSLQSLGIMEQTSPNNVIGAAVITHDPDGATQIINKPAVNLSVVTAHAEMPGTPEFPTIAFHETGVKETGNSLLNTDPASAGDLWNVSHSSGFVPDLTIDSSTNSKRARDRTEDDVAEGGPPSKRLKSGRTRPYALVNISQLRAENEFLRVVAASGGIANISSKEFLETHARVIAAMVDSGESTSMAVGTQPDRRTIRKIFGRLEERGRLKILTVTVAPHVGQPRPVKLAYDLGVTQERLDQYLATLREDVPALGARDHKKLEQPIDYTRSKRRARDLFLSEDGLLQGGNENENWRRDLDISGLDDDAVRSAILSEDRTVAQLYGFLVGRARRARELHQFTLAHLQGRAYSPYVVSSADRIVAFPYYYTDLPVSTYFAIISATTHSTELSKLMESPQGRQTLVKDLPLDLHDDLKIGRARARNKILELLEILVFLKLVTPLQPSSSDKPYLNCNPNGDHPTRFDIISISEAKRTAIPSLYWHFNTIAPVYLYSLSESWPPKFDRDMFIRTADESMPFWLELEDACLNKERRGSVTSVDSITGPFTCTLEVARGLRRRHSWVSSYILSWNQKQYLHRWTNPSTGYTPLSDDNGGRDCLENISKIISAPIDAVYQFFVSSRTLFTNEMERIRERDRRRKEGRTEREAAEGRVLLAKKAAEARLQLEADWEALVQRIHSGPTPYGSGARLKHLHTQYLQSRTSMNDQKWEALVLDAISKARSEKYNPVLSSIASSIPRKASRTVGIPHLPLVTAIQQKSVTELIERQKERIAAFQAAPQKKKGKKEVSIGVIDAGTTITPEAPRRQRFQWTPEYDELARDASAIIRARCRTWHRMDWTALGQLFPFLPRNNVRQRLTTLRQEAGGDSYLRLLEDKWHELWLEHRGTEVLPDDNPASPSEFDAIAHVEFLRRYIDKRALRVGLSHVDVENPTGAILLETITDFFAKWRVKERQRSSNKMDVVWTATGDEHREKTFLGEAFSLIPATCHLIGPSPLANGVAESGLKMALTTPDEDYDVNNATLFLNSIGQESVCQASDELLARGVVSKSGKGQQKRPGRKLKISSLNEDALGGSFHPDFYAEACATEDMFDDGTNYWREWSAIATDGEMAAFIELVSARKAVEFHIDVSGPASQRQQVDWNSKKVDDDQITTVLAMRFRPSNWDDAAPSDSFPESPAFMPIPVDSDEAVAVGHGQNCGEPAPCRKESQGVITCSACLNAEQNAFLAKLDPEGMKLSLELIERLNSVGWTGLSPEALSILPQPQGTRVIIDRMTSGSDPQCYWIGYAHPVLVSRRHIRRWTVSIPGLSNPRLVFPRRWLNIKGEKMENKWNAGLRAVVGVLVNRPGISQTELRERLISIYDRQELNDLLDHLCMEGLIARRVSPENPNLQSKNIRAVDVHEEQEVCWTPTWNSWYRVDMAYV